MFSFNRQPSYNLCYSFNYITVCKIEWCGEINVIPKFFINNAKSRECYTNLNIADLFRLDPIRDLTTVNYVHIKVIILYLHKYT